MDFQIECPCGLKLTVNEAQADGTVDCACGQAIKLPSLKEMRVRSGLPPYNISPELLIENILRSGEVPWERSCVRCDQPTDDLILVVTYCERVIVQETGRPSGLAILFTALLSPILAAIWSTRRGETQQFGKDKVYPLPLPVCAACQKMLTSPPEIKRCLAVVPAYRLLLEKFPEAGVRVTECRRTTIVRDDPERPASMDTSFRKSM